MTTPPPSRSTGLRTALAATRVANVVVAGTLSTLVGTSAVVSMLTAAGVVRVNAELTGSMAPAIQVHDLIVHRPVKASGLHEGDIITFRRDTSPVVITHRIVDIATTPEALDMRTQGDANPTPDVENLEFDPAETVWRVAHIVPSGGFPLDRAIGRGGLGLTLGLTPFYLLLPVLRKRLSAELAQRNAAPPSSSGTSEQIPKPRVETPDDAVEGSRSELENDPQRVMN